MFFQAFNFKNLLKYKNNSLQFFCRFIFLYLNMKLTIQFQFEKEQNWQFDQHILQGIFWKAIEHLDNIHWNIGFYTFSNIFPFEKGQNYKANTDYNISVKSIRKDIILSMYEYFSLHSKIDFDKENKLKIKKVFISKTEPYFAWKIIKWITPIVISLNKELVEKYGIVYKNNKKPLYWNKDMWFEVFVKQLDKNIIKQYVYLLNELISGKLDFDLLSLDIKNKFWKIEDWEKDLLKIYENKWDKQDLLKMWFKTWKWNAKPIMPNTYIDSKDFKKDNNEIENSIIIFSMPYKWSLNKEIIWEEKNQIDNFI